MPYIKLVAVLAILVGFSCATRAQQESQFTQYMFNRLSYNPAYAGSSGSICATALYRSQWLGLKLDAPTSNVKAGSLPTDYLFQFDMPVKALHGGLGLSVIGEQIGYHNNVGVNLDYAFRIYWGPGNLAAAIEANIVSKKFDMAQLLGSDDLTGEFSNPGSGTTSDPMVLQHSETSDFLFDLSTGLYYQVPGEYYIGVAAKNLLGTKSATLNYANVRTVYGIGGIDYTVPFNPSFKIRPSFLLKTTNFATWQCDLSCLVDYQNTFWLGAAYRVNDAVSFMGGVNWKKLRVGAAYDLTTSRLGTFKAGRSCGSAELYLRYCFKIVIPKKAPSVYRNTRYLF